ncbi:autophagy-related protein 27 [Zopfochytrium polystomum]|nr:autophagy-related protein 27 [Zopfochytrium polystomum]
MMLAWVVATTGLLIPALLPAANAAIECSEKTTILPYEFNMKDLIVDVVLKGIETDTPPTKNSVRFHVNVCKTLTKESSVSEEDFCTSSHICEVVTNRKESDSKPDRVIQVKNWAAKRAETADAAVSSDGQTLSFGFMESSWGGSSLKTNVTLICDAAAGAGVPEVSTVDSILTVTWKTKAACGIKVRSGAGPGNATAGMSIGALFFWLLFMGATAYLILGTLFNYYVNHVRRFPEMLPNYDLWKSLFSHIQDRVSSRSYVSI